MAEKENYPPRVTCAAAKRASAMEASRSQPPWKKKRVELSDLPNSCNAATSRPPRLTRAAAKRASAMGASRSQPPSKKKRLALSDLPNPSNAATSRCRAVPSEIKSTISGKKEQDSELQKSSLKVIEVSSVIVSTTGTTVEENEIEDAQMVCLYASDIYQYLRSMEIGI